MDQIRIGKYIAEKRKGLNLTQAQLAEQLGMSDKSVSKWERGLACPDLVFLDDLAELLDIGLEELLIGNTTPCLASA